MILRAKLASINDSEQIDHVCPAFPLTFETFINTIQQEFGDETLKQLSLQFDETQEQLQNCRTLINMMNIKFLKREELEQLAKIVFDCKQQSTSCQEAMSAIYKEIKISSEDVNGFVWDKIDGTDYKQIKLPHEVVRQEKANLEREFTSRRVRNVHYRKQPIKVLKSFDTGMVKQLAFCCDSGTAVECYKIPKVFMHFEILTQFFNQIGATKELLFSKYLPSYLGFDDQTDPDFNQYFFEIKKGKSLKNMMVSKETNLLKYNVLFKYWAKELLYAMRDITYKSTFTIQKKVTLKNVYVSDIGLKLNLKKIKFGE